MVAIDNLSVVRVLIRLQVHMRNFGREPVVVGQCAPLWQREVCRLFASEVPVTVIWVPSHGKSENWQPSAPYEEDGPNIRAFNEAADEECNKVLGDEWPKQEPFRRQWSEAHSWSVDATQMQVEACDALAAADSSGGVEAS